MTIKEAIEIMNYKCENTFLLLQTDGDSAKALATLMTSAEKLEVIRNGWESAGYPSIMFEDSNEEYWKKFFYTTKKNDSDLINIHDITYH